MKLYIGADLVPTPASQSAFQSGDLSGIIQPELLAKLNTADYRIFNLECPLIDGGTPIEKFGPAISAPANCVEGIRALGTDLVTLANNHSLDYGAEGLASTRSSLQSAGIVSVGAGVGEEQCGSYRLLHEGVKLGIYCCTEHEFSVTASDQPGAVAYDPAVSLADVAHLKETCDRVIVLYHGGREMWQYPTPALRERCHHLVRAGADLVVCQHSHCIGCKEEPENGIIYYGQGNFHFDLPEETDDLWCTSLLLEIELTLDAIRVTPIPLRLADHKLSLADGEDAAAILNALELRSAQLSDGDISQQFRLLLDQNAEHYLVGLSGNRFYRFFPRLLNKLTSGRYKKRKLKKMYQQEDLLRLINYIECETHREMLVEILRQALSETKR